MIKEFLRRYLLAFVIAISCWIALVYFIITEPENFLTGESIIWAIIGWLATTGSVVGLILHSWDWVEKNRDKYRKS